LSTICARKSAVLGLINKSLILPENFSAFNLSSRKLTSRVITLQLNSPKTQQLFPSHSHR
ncbi:hypothetical protein, partial [Synechococcus sp. Cruz CV12-2-Slac-r]|uniref:hypothetical protein n=1 Tax=Synechococcus sp. Cruz CV12-2-Slac-r TaxID=2823748 RepID=UPI0020CE07CB